MNTRGFLGIVSLLIGTALIIIVSAFLLKKEVGLRALKKENGQSAIQKAEDAKKAIEAHTKEEMQMDF